jgi:hypothetical protein
MVKCPRCGNILYASPGESEVECTCHLYCSEGSKPSDCAMEAVTYTGKFGYPRGMHVNSDSELDADRPKHEYRCTVHERYSDKKAMIIEFDWPKLPFRASPQYRELGVT